MPRNLLRTFIVVLAFFALFGLGCQGTVADPGGDPSEIGDGRTVPPGQLAGGEWETAESGIRRLTRREYAASVGDLLGFEPERAYEFLPADGREPFDNNSATQSMSDALTSGVERLAMNIAADFVADEVGRATVMPCEPRGAGDAVCFREFVESFTLRAFRRPLESEEVERFIALFAFAEEADDFYFGVETVIMAVLQDPRFLFRLEVGEPVAGDPQLHQLDAWEVATRLSFLIWGTSPNDWLINQVQEGRLATSVGIASVATEMFDDERMLDQAVRYHEQWLDYEVMGGDPAMAARFKKEVDALVRRVVGENLAWTDLLTLEEAYIDSTLAEHYDVTAPEGDGFAWANLSESDRGGLLGQGAFMTNEAQRRETDPTARGALIRARLFCQVLVVPGNVDVDVLVDAETEAEANACTPARLAVHAQGGCANCHSLTDPIGFGLEQYDMTGGFREHETDKPECVIEGQGEVAGVGTFGGSAELGQLMRETDEVRSCFVQQLQRFSSGRAESTRADVELSQRLADELGNAGTYQDAIVSLVSQPSFAQRRLESAMEGE